MSNNEDLMQVNDDEEEREEQEVKAEPPVKGIIKLGSEAKYSVGMTGDEEDEARKALLQRLRDEEEKISEQSLLEYLRVIQA